VHDLATDIADTSCGVFFSISEALDPEKLHRFIVGEDEAPQAMEAREAAEALGDPFATLVLLRGVFPRTAAEVLDAIDAATADGDPLRQQMSFVLGEGSQIPVDAETAGLRRSMRFLVTRGTGPQGPDLLMSAFSPDQAEAEVMAWDARSGGFNYYRPVGPSVAWVFVGNSRHALLEPTEGKGPFESHTSGNFLMKELRAPWVHWHSPDANVFPTAFPDGDPLREHPWFTAKEPQGALTCELQVAKPGISRWTAARFEALLAGDGSIERPGRILAQILDTPTVNLISSHAEGTAVGSEPVDLPQTFFVDSEGLCETLGLQAPEGFAVGGPIYASSLNSFNVRLSDGEGFERPGDTHFAFVVPEPAFEDSEVLRAAIRVGLITERLAACLLMTDFPNPVFSTRRASLLAHVPGVATVTQGQSGFSQEMADAILGAAPGTPDGSPEREFAERWEAGEEWRVQFGLLLADYYRAVGEGLRNQERFDDYFVLAESRRERVRGMPISENPLLFARSDAPLTTRAMAADGSVLTTGEV